MVILELVQSGFVLWGPDSTEIFNECDLGNDCDTSMRTLTVPEATWNGWITTFGSDLTFLLLADTSVDLFCEDYYQLTVILGSATPAVLTNDFNGTDDASGFYPVGTTTVTWTITDGAGNSSQCTQDITVNDVEAPQIVCGGPLDVILDANGMATINASDLNVTGGIVIPGSLYALYPWDDVTDNIARYDYNSVTDAIALIDNPYGSTSRPVNFGLDRDPTTGQVYLLSGDGVQSAPGTRRIHEYDLASATLGTEIGTVCFRNGIQQCKLHGLWQ